MTSHLFSILAALMMLCTFFFGILNAITYKRKYAETMHYLKDSKKFKTLVNLCPPGITHPKVNALWILLGALILKKYFVKKGLIEKQVIDHFPRQLEKTLKHSAYSVLMSGFLFFFFSALAMVIGKL